jgi:hypothetical protein
MSVEKKSSSGFTKIEVDGFVNNDAQLEIIDLAGRSMIKEKMNASAYFAESFVDISSFKAGTYLIRITTGNSVYTKTLVKN